MWNEMSFCKSRHRNSVYTFSSSVSYINFSRITRWLSYPAMIICVIYMYMYHIAAVQISILYTWIYMCSFFRLAAVMKVAWRYYSCLYCWGEKLLKRHRLWLFLACWNTNSLKYHFLENSEISRILPIRYSLILRYRTCTLTDEIEFMVRNFDMKFKDLPHWR